MKLGKRIAALELLQRVTQHKIDDLAAPLNRLRQEIADLTQQHAKLQHSLEAEAYEVTLESAPYLGRFIAAVQQQQHFLSLQIQSLNDRAQTLEDEILGHFRDKKSLDSPLDSARDLQRLEAARRESSANDEIAITRRFPITHMP